MHAIHYSKSWFRAKKRPVEPYSEAKARALHEAGSLYCAQIGQPDAPSCFLEITGDWIGVEFLDEQLRSYLSYSFQEQESGRLFLSMTTWREFAGLTDTVVMGTTYVFQVNGEVTVTEETFHPTYALTESQAAVDVSSNWDSFPLFGRYSSLIRVER